MYNLWNFVKSYMWEVQKMSKDRQETKLRKSGHVASDRDPSLENDGATKLSSPEEARRLNDNKR
jgi:hypothetical protein